MPECHVATCIYKADDDMVEMLCVYAYSATKNMNCKVFVYCDGLTEKQKQRVSQFSDDVFFVPVKLEHEKKDHMPAMKVPLWDQIVNDPIHDGKHLILSDFDMLFLRDPNVFWLMEGASVDLAFTPKDNQSEKFRLNTGIMFIRGTWAVRRLFKDWHKTVLMISQSKEHSDQAVKQHGSIDQASFAKYLDPSDFFKEVKRLDCRLKGVPSSRYNLHKDWGNISEYCSVIHFKSGWPKILLSGDDFETGLKVSGWDKLEESKEWEPSYKLWRECYNEMILN
tara:strand:- start:4592 stop:5431 length:840 start_codon:yes stop_codon:yes gene_type:complete